MKCNYNHEPSALQAARITELPDERIRLEKARMMLPSPELMRLKHGPKIPADIPN